MTKRYIVWVYLLLCCCWLPLSVMAQQKDAKLKAMALIKELREAKIYVYDYTSRSIFPDGQSEAVTGTLYTDGLHKCYLDKNKLSLMLLTPQWYLRINHTEQSVAVINLDKYYKTHKRQELIDKNYQADVALNMADTLVGRYGKVDLYENTGGIIKTTISFVDQFYIEKMEIVYNTLTRLPVSFYVRSKARSAYGTGVITKEYRCSNYRKEVNAGSFAVAPFFEQKGNALVLKQYKHYKKYSIL